MQFSYSLKQFMKAHHPKISIGLTVYNGQNFLRESLDSITNQTFRDFELIISDNNSSDATQDICREYATLDKRIRYFRNEKNLGVNLNCKRVFDLSTGEYFKWMADDDLYAPTYLAECLRVLEEDPSIVLCHSKTALIDQHGERILYDKKENCFIDKYGNRYQELDPLNQVNLHEPHSRYGRVLKNIRWCHASFGLIRAKELRKINLERAYYGWDKAILVELSLMGKFAEIPDELFFNRRHSNQSASLSTVEKSNYTKPGSQYGPLYCRLLCSTDYFLSIFRVQLKLIERVLSLKEFFFWMINPMPWRRLLQEIHRS